MESELSRAAIQAMSSLAALQPDVELEVDGGTDEATTTFPSLDGEQIASVHSRIPALAADRTKSKRTATVPVNL